jgi:hypothetical protein
MFMMSPAFGMLFNTKEKRWHPILFLESPLPGPPEAGKPVRLKSKGHHTAGFATREEAVKDIETKSKEIDPKPVVDVEKDIEWDGEGIPAMTALLADNKLVFL